MQNNTISTDVILNNIGKPVLPARKRSKSTKKPDEFYVSPKEFRIELEKYYKTNIFHNKLGDMVKKIAYNMSYCPNFINYTYKDEMISDAIAKMSRAIVRKNFRIESEFSPFAYFSQISWHSFQNRISKEKKIQQTHDEYKERIYNDMLEDQCEELSDVYLKRDRSVLSDGSGSED